MKSLRMLTVFSLAAPLAVIAILIYVAPSQAMITVIEEAAPEPRIVASMSLSEGRNPHDPCAYSKRVDRVEVYADGRVTMVRNDHGTRCLPDASIVQRAQVGSKRQSKLTSERLAHLVATLREAQASAQEQMRLDAQLSDKEKRSREMTRRLILQVSADPEGASSSLDLPQAVDVSGPSAQGLDKIRSAIEAVVTI